MAQNDPVSPGELEERLSTVRELMVKGMAQRQIVRYCIDELKWDVKERQMRNYCHTVMEQMGDEAKTVNRAAYWIRTIERLDFLYAQAVKVMDYKTALGVIDRQVKVMRLEQPNASMDWRNAAKEAGLPPSELLNNAIDMLEKMSQSGDAKEVGDWLN